MTKSNLILIGSMLALSSLAQAEEATIATESAPLKASAGLGGKTVATLPGGAKVNKLSQTGMWAKVEFTDEAGKKQTGFVSAAALTTGTSVLGNLGKGKRIAAGGAKEALGAAGKGGSGASASAMDGMLNAAGGDSAATDDILDDEAELDEAPAAAAAPKASASKFRAHIDTITIGDAEIMAFMKAGGLKSRLLK